jgi:hypothetical protein
VALVDCAHSDDAESSSASAAAQHRGLNLVMETSDLLDSILVNPILEEKLLPGGFTTLCEVDGTAFCRPGVGAI